MIQKVKGRKLNMPMLEIIITLGILTIVSVFLMRLFLGANSLETKAKDIGKACILAENIAETIKGADTIDIAVSELGLKKLHEKESKDVFVKYYDSGWKEQEEPSIYTIQVAITRKLYNYGTLFNAEVTVTKDKPYAVIKKDEEPLASIVCSSYKINQQTAASGQ